MPITAGLTEGCLSCICEVNGGPAFKGCMSKCGPFGLDWNYWSNCGKPNAGKFI